MRSAVRKTQSHKMKPVFLFACLMMCSLLFAQNKNSHSTEQLAFSAEDSAVKKPVAIPADVMAILAKDEMVKNELENENLPVDKIPAEWFSASAVHLSKANLTDYVVMAEPPLAGGNVVTFWVFRDTGHGHDLVLTAPEHDLIVKKTRSNGYRDIELDAMTAVTISTVLCRFDGKQYKEYKSKQKNL